MATADVSQQGSSPEVSLSLDRLPPDLLEIIRSHPSPSFLESVSQAALRPTVTDRIFVHFESLFPDICARWILKTSPGTRHLGVEAAFARILPFAPYLACFLRCYAPVSPAAGEQPSLHLLLPHIDETSSAGLDTESLLESLVTTWRLLHFDFRTFNCLASPSFMQSLFGHSDRAIRYVAILIFCQLLHASDSKLETLLREHVGMESPIFARFDGISIDYLFLSLHERTRAERILSLREHAHRDLFKPGRKPNFLTEYSLSYGRNLLPRPRGPINDPSNIVMTSTTTNNIDQLSFLLRERNPILLHGLPGVGKSSLVREIARQLGTYSSMVTLHLNEQTDAKVLLGLYSMDSKPGSFQWRPGVLTTAVREGRWVLVEDIDRAPTEVLSTLLPLIERRELLIPSRGETIHAANGFRLFATVRTTLGMHGRETLPNIVGMRFWSPLYTEPLTQPELKDVVCELYPLLRKFIPGILAVNDRLSRLINDPAFLSLGRHRAGREANLRDLLKWCRRLSETLSLAGSKTGDDPIGEETRDWMFMDALDCYVGNCPDSDLGRRLSYAIAEEMHIPRERVDYYLSARVPAAEESSLSFGVGRARLRKKELNRLQKSQKSSRPFASTAHAKRLLEQISMAVRLREPVLLVGETGIGKTTVVQQLAETLGHKLIVVNLSQQSEVGDLLGGFKPVNVRSLAVPLKEEFEDLFAATGISVSKNQKYLELVGKCLAKGQWSRLSKLWREAPKMFSAIVAELERTHSKARDDDLQPAKRQKTQSKLRPLLGLQSRWDSFSKNLDQFDAQISGGSRALAFSFIEGNIVKAVRNGDWVLLDEINLASPDTLESIADLLAGSDERPSILLSETGEIEKIEAHDNFRIFGAMNPATDIGKKDLPIGIRSRFTEIYVQSPDADLKDLLTIIKTYLGSNNSKTDQAADDIARLYLNTKRMAKEKRLVDGANEVPHFSLRTLTRVLSYVNTIAPFYGLRRALYEGFSMGFLTLLDRESEKILLPLIYHHLLDKHGNPQSLLSQPPKHPTDGRQYVKFQNQNRDRQYWLFKGEEPTVARDDYIITPYVERNLLNLVRATSTGKFPILIQGPTSAGKTSMIEYLANYSGNKFVRINNHEHTDLQEYLGTYMSDPDGKLFFQEGLLVQAMRRGHWIVLDELNLAPTDVLEALNRLLDDNRELLIPETQEIVRPHPNFILFATQNPPGIYGGRKVLSRAFRNRFLELHFDDIPQDELEFILQHRSRKTSPPDCRRIVAVYKELSLLRQTSRVFEQKDSFATLRDLFRWALRDAETREDIAIHGFMLLAERVRNEEERLAVKSIIEKVFKVTIDPQNLYSPDVAPELRLLHQQRNAQGVVWTHSMRRLYVLVSRALRNNEPVLLVGETGCGKTTVCQLLAESLRTELRIVNAHQNTETGDLIGSQRPIRNRGAIFEALDTDLTSAFKSLGCEEIPQTIEDKLAKFGVLDKSLLQRLPAALIERINANEIRSKALFEWTDGALVEAMRGGHYFLLDEISLADDSVLERLNSVLEPQRTLLLAEKGSDDSLVTASQGFQFFATMNPGGDFGKKELSPALRNRFTEIWVPQLSETDDIRDIVRAKLGDKTRHLVDAMIKFASWFGRHFRPMSTTSFSVREVLVWVQFMNTFQTSDPLFSLVHGAAAIFIDSLGANPSATLATDIKSIRRQRLECVAKLGELVGCDVSAIYKSEPRVVVDENFLTMGPFSIPRLSTVASTSSFAFHAPTTRQNAMRVVRALQMDKPILLEGSPGVGKTSLIVALSQACGRPLTRINLSDQTDLMDLFGTDVPVEGEEVGHFAWRDAPFLQAMQRGEWVLLDEMNLASQSVLEGLNACLDHRGEVYISELDQVFKRHPDFRLFAAQNPHHQGGGRKGLPASFVNRFIVVYADIFEEEDLQIIASHSFPSLSTEIIGQLIGFISELERQLVVEKSFGSQGGPWELNLRDILRWLSLLSSPSPLLQNARVDDFLDMVVRQRFRTQKDRDEVNRIFGRTTGRKPRSHQLYHDVNCRFSQVGLALLHRSPVCRLERLPAIDIIPRLPELESLMLSIEQNIPCILSSPSGFGKSVLLRYVAALAGKSLVVFSMNADIDAMDLVGGYEQADPLRAVNAVLGELRDYLRNSVMNLCPTPAPAEALQLLHSLSAYDEGSENIDDVRAAVDLLLSSVSPTSEAAVKLSKAQQLLAGPLVLANPRFEWLDGVIVKALESGDWLVLDNANMCSASVLDRLNSLLEPDGFLSINEHCSPDGKPRIVKPHPEFRVFLTVDPRYGELSRAMRNRAIEIYLHRPPPKLDASLDRIAELGCDLLRYGRSMRSCESGLPGNVDADVCRVALENLSVQDVCLLPRVVDEISRNFKKSDTLLRSMQSLLLFFQSVGGADILQALMKAYDTLAQDFAPGVSRAQPLHALNNFAVTQSLPRKGEPQWLAARYETSRMLFHLQQAIDIHRNQSRSAKLGSLNRLQRSLISDRVAAVSKDTTAKLASFLSSVIGAIQAFISSESSSFEAWKERSHLLRILGYYLERTIFASIEHEFDEARFQAHLSLGIKIFKGQSQSCNGDVDALNLVSLANTRLKADLSNEFEPSTGLSMELLWRILRPIPIPNKSAYDQTLELGRLSARFDTLRWKASAAISELSKAQETLDQVYSITRSGQSSAGGLLIDLDAAIRLLEARIGDDEADLKPFLGHEFGYLRQLDMLRHMALEHQIRWKDNDLAMLSNVPSKPLMLLANSSESGLLLQSVDCLMCQDSASWDGRLAMSLWQKLHDLGGVSLASLMLLDAELPVLGRYISDLSADIAADPLDKLNDVLWKLVLQTLVAHDPHLEKLAHAAYDEALQCPGLMLNLSRNDTLHGNHAFGQLVSGFELKHLLRPTVDHFLPAIFGIAAAKGNTDALKTQFSAWAWVHFSVGLVQLYVPDRVFDPQLRPQVELEFFEGFEAYLHDKILELKLFEKSFTGQETNLQIQLLEEELAETRPSLPDTLQPVFRPKISELTRLQTEFANVVKTLTGSGVSQVLRAVELNSAGEGGLHLMRENISRLIDRFDSGFEAYQDMVQPAVNILRCFLIGLSLCEATTSIGMKTVTNNLVEATPFFGSRSWDPCVSKLPIKNFEFLSLMGARAAVEGIGNLPKESLEAIFKTFHGFFDDWTEKLEADRKAEESKASLYRFRGSLQDDEEVDEKEFNELFPTYGEEDAKAHHHSKAADGMRSFSLRAAQAHKTLFLQSMEPTAAIRSACMAVGERVSQELNSSVFVDRSINSKMLPATMLLLNEKVEELRSDATGKSYNFYTDTNFPEVRQLVALVDRIKIRFRELQLVDEIGHMQPLADVIQSCNHLLGEAHAEPLAKLLPRVEHLHAHLYEWQFGGWASKVYAVLSLYDALTATIIRWRRLELSTWANLFDMEQEKCQDDAYSWWFIAYQVVIATPLTIIGSPSSPSELRQYGVSLVQSLEQYFSSAIVGQFRTRAALLKQLSRHLGLLAKEHPELDVIHFAVENFLEFTTRFGKPADAAIQSGRMPIEKKMKDVLLMASWKDTNINALRESSRKSHQKLFRLVRQFRGVLGQEMKTVIAQGIPDENMSFGCDVVPKSLVEIAAPKVESKRLDLVLPGWLDNHRRLANVSTTLSVMRSVAQAFDTPASAVEMIDDFVTGLNSSMAELRNETPSVLTEENKVQIKHLKTRKRRLFANTLRDLRHMGLQYNLSRDKLAEQESIAAIFASLPPVELDSAATREAGYMFHKLLDLAPRVRSALRDHSEDLTGAEVGRSVGFVEGMISLTMSQRQKLARSQRSLGLLRDAATRFRTLGDFEQHGLLTLRKQHRINLRLLPWILQILHFAARLVQIHSKLSGTNDTDAVEDELKSWAARFESHVANSESFARLPLQLASEALLRLEASVSDDCEALRARLHSLSMSYPKIAFILQHVDSWSQAQYKRVEMPVPEAGDKVNAFFESVSTMTDTVLAAVENAKQKVVVTPVTSGAKGWLVTDSDMLFSTIQHLHMMSVERSVRHSIEVLQNINMDDRQVSIASMGLVHLAAPILDQYSEFCFRLVQRGGALHRSTVKLAYNLTRAFTQIASSGFCTPQEQSDEKNGEAGQLESGTGLGDGEGAEDISHDIQPDEDLSELAQEANKDDAGDVEDEKDAVDMADEELEGEMGSVNGKEDDDDDGSAKNGDEEDQDMDEEAGDVDDLDPTAVDEKMWDGDDEKADKDQQGNKAVGQKDNDEQMAAEEKQKPSSVDQEEQGDGTDERQDDAESPDAEEGTAMEELNRQDQNVQENDALDLPDDMNLDMDEEGSASSDSDELDLMSDVAEEDRDDGEQQGETAEDEDLEMDKAAPEATSREVPEDEDGDEGEGESGADDANKAEDETVDDVDAQEEQEEANESMEPTAQPRDDSTVDADQAAPSNVKSLGQETSAESMDLDEEFHGQAAQQDDGNAGDGEANQARSAGATGEMSQAEMKESAATDADAAERERSEASRKDPFRKLGDALQKWHRRQAEIQDADEDGSQKRTEPLDGSNLERQEFQHVENDEAAGDTQAMGGAKDEEAQPIDDSMAIDEEERNSLRRTMEEDAEDEVPDQADSCEATEAQKDQTEKADADDRSGVKTRKGQSTAETMGLQAEGQQQEPVEGERENTAEEENDMAEEAQEDEERLSWRLPERQKAEEKQALREYEECVRQWSELQSKSQGLSLSLTSQLRLILTPSQATKLSGSFRTGKRLNIKRIIPYLASSYKRDKIWMRRSVPTKRRYQILLCVDDSKSMGESSSGRLAMESLVMVSRSLSMLEAGQVGVLGFGRDVFVAHALGEPMGGDAGARVLQHFTFEQDGTEVGRLMRRIMDSFGEARQRQPGAGGEELWQLALVLSDGLTPSSSHDAVRRLVREAMESRIMTVFIIMDDSGKRRGDSVLELKEARFEKDEGGASKVVIERYLDTFPFPYYLIVHDLEELPSALAGLLRTWFAEVAV